MPTLNWIGKDKVINHHAEVPFRVLEHKYGFRGDNPNDTSETHSGNKIIHGDNLEALKALLPEYEGKIDCVYIDPPYNTGNEGWVYNDNVNDPHICKWLGEVVGSEREDFSRHDKWLCMMYPRLRLLYQLLSQQGVIFISIDDNEYNNLKTICDEIFSAKNYVKTFIWHTEGHTDNQDIITSVHEYILCYAKEKNSVSFNHVVDPNVPDDSKIKRDFAENSITKNGAKNPPVMIELPIGFPCEVNTLFVEADKQANELIQDAKSQGFISREITKRYNISYPVRCDDMVVENGQLVKPCNVFSGWMNNAKLQKFIDNKCKPIEDKDTMVKFYLSKNGVIYYRRDGRNSRYIQTVLNNMGTTETNKYMIEKMGLSFDYPKPVELIKYLISLQTRKGSIILDSFAGSGTTSHSVLALNSEITDLNLKFILIELGDYAETLTAKRTKCAISGFGEKQDFTQGLGGSFDYYELGEPLFQKNGNINEGVGVEKMREYIYYTETHEHLIHKQEKDYPYLLDYFNGIGYFFYYKPNEITTLSHDTLNIVPKKADHYVIYADVCSISSEQLAQMNITFKKIPRDINRF